MASQLLLILDYICWIVQAFITLFIALRLMLRLKHNGFNDLMLQLVALIICESCCTLIFEPLFWINQKSPTTNLIISITIGGELGFKWISLWFFGLKYLKSCLELPSFQTDRNGELQIKLTKETDAQYFERTFTIVKYMGIFVIMVAWAAISTAQYFFNTHGFKSTNPVLKLFAAENMISAAMSLILASLIAYPVIKIWRTLSNVPSLQRNERTMMIHLVVVLTYALFFIGNTVIVIGLLKTQNQPEQQEKWIDAYNTQGIVLSQLSFASNMILLYLIHQFNRVMVNRKFNQTTESSRHSEHSQKTEQSEQLEGYDNVQLMGSILEDSYQENNYEQIIWENFVTMEYD